jgi:hypothetical protein
MSAQEERRYGSLLDLVTEDSEIAGDMAALAREYFLEDVESGFYIDLEGGRLKRQERTFVGEQKEIEFDESEIGEKTVGSYHTHPVPTLIQGRDIQPILNHQDLAADLGDGLRLSCTGIMWHEIDWEKGGEQFLGNLMCAERSPDVSEGEAREVLEGYENFLVERAHSGEFGGYYGFEPEEADGEISEAYEVKRLSLTPLLGGGL